MQDKFCHSIDGAASLMSVSRRSLYREITAGRLQAISLGKRRLVSSDAIRDWIKAASSKSATTQVAA